MSGDNVDSDDNDDGDGGSDHDGDEGDVDNDSYTFYNDDSVNNSNKNEHDGSVQGKAWW